MMFEELGGYCFSLTAFFSDIHQLMGEELDINLTRAVSQRSHVIGCVSRRLTQLSIDCN